MDDPERSDPGLGGRLAKLRDRFEAAWGKADEGGTLPDIDAYLDGLADDEAPAARILLESIDRARRARLAPTPEPSDAPTIDSSPAIRPPGASFGADGEASTMADPEPPPTPEPAVTAAATDVFESGRPRPDEPPETVADPIDPHATVDLATTIAVSTSWKAPRRGSPIPSQIIPGYEVLGELGRGGMGVVYKARQIRADRVVALKMVLAGAHASDDQLARFAIEAQAVAHLQHPGIVQIYDVGEHDGLPYFSLEFVEGGSLAAYIAGKPQSPRRAAEVVADLAEAMAVAHSRNILHRDLKPANVLLTPDGRPKITDFGLAKKLEGDSQQTRSGAVMGTPSYMAPEQAFGLTREIGPPADQYALGAILYEMLTGRPPFQGATPLETLELARNEEPVPPRRLQPKVPADLETIALKALQKEVPRRYADTGGLARDLRRYLDGSPIEARPVSFPERSWRWCRRNPRVASLSASVAALVLIGLVGSTFAAFSFNNQNFALRIEEQRAKTAQKVAERNAGIADEKTKVAVEKTNEARKAIDTAFEQTRNSLNSVRLISKFANELKFVSGTRSIREKMQKNSGDGLDSNMKIIDALKALALDSKTEHDAVRLNVSVSQRAGQIALEIGRTEEAARRFAAMQESAEELLAKFPDDQDSLMVLAATSNTLGDFRRDEQDDLEGARALYEKALDLRRRWLARPRSPQDALIARDGVGVNLRLVAMAWRDLGDPVKARDYLLQEEKLRDEMDVTPENSRNTRLVGAELVRLLGQVEIQLGNRSAGVDLYRRSLDQFAALTNDFPEDLGVLLGLQESGQLLGHSYLMILHDPAGALGLYESSLSTFRDLSKNEPSDLTRRSSVALAEYFCGEASRRLHRVSESEDHFKACLRIRREIAAASEAAMPKLYLMLALARCGEHAEAATIADELAARPKADNRTVFQTACGYALCAGAVAKGRPVESLPAAEADLAGRYSGRAFDMLRKLLARGWKSPVDFEIDPDLDPIRDDPRFASILAEARLAAGIAARPAEGTGQPPTR